MTHSTTEIASLATRAARGAGFPPDQAERYGKAAALHLALGADESPLIAALEDTASSPILRLPLIMDDVMRAVSLLGPDVALSLHDDDLDLAPSYLRLVPMGVEELRIEAREEGPPRVHLRVATQGAKPALPARLCASEDLLRHWGRHAKATLVPASEASRARGAGAGLTDND